MKGAAGGAATAAEGTICAGKICTHENGCACKAPTVSVNMGKQVSQCGTHHSLCRNRWVQGDGR